MALSTKRISVYAIVGVLLAAAVIAAVYSSGIKLPSSASSTGDANSGTNGNVPGSTQTVAHAGTLVVSIKDAPVEIAELWVTIDSIEVHSSENGWAEVALLDGATTEPFDLLTLQGEKSLDLSQVQLSAGTYNKVRLHVSEAKFAETAEGELFDLKVPSGKIDVIISFDVVEGGSTKVLIDMTADWVAISASHNLRPVLKATVTYEPAPSGGAQQAASTNGPQQTEEPTSTPTTPPTTSPSDNPSTETSPTPTPTPTPSPTPTESPTSTASTSV